ncbi:MAG: rod shape-determining protein MreD [Rhodobacteraceae bacterium]|nr:rod shape-determining protein MreD [Paracoccaceae bacterium]
MATETHFGGQVLRTAGIVLLCAALTFAQLLPVDTAPGLVPGPDLVLAVMLAGTIRRPDLFPVWLVALVMVASDLLAMRPPGLSAALVVVATEWLRRRHRRFRGMGFGAEIAMVAILCTGLVTAQWLVLALFVVAQPPLWAELLQVPVTVAFYPLVVLLCRQVLGIRRPTAIDGYGRGARA